MLKILTKNLDKTTVRLHVYGQQNGKYVRLRAAGASGCKAYTSYPEFAQY